MPANSSPPTVKRSDARRNRDSILSAARSAFADPDARVSMAEISRRAGVGMATLYRNFPSRRALLEALYAAEVDAVCEAAKTASGASPGAALRAWLRQFFAFGASKKHLAAELLTHVNSDSPVFNDNRTRVLAAGRPLFDAAQRVHQIRDDLTFEQALDMLVSIATIDGNARYQEPILQTVLDGLAPPAVPSDD
jgi:AcrR family transcriptional regulator